VSPQLAVPVIAICLCDAGPSIGEKRKCGSAACKAGKGKENAAGAQKVSCQESEQLSLADGTSQSLRRTTRQRLPSQAAG
jgi:hypothetical protein